MEFQIHKKSPQVPLVSSIKRRTQNNLVEVVLLVLVIGLFFWFIVIPKKANLVVKQQRAAELRVEEGKLSGDLAQLKALVEELKANSNNVAKLDEALPLTQNTARVHLLVEQMARSSGATISDLNVVGESEAVVAGNVEILDNPFTVARSRKTLDVSVNVLGSFDQLKAFLQKLEKNGRIFNVAALGIKGTEEGLLELRLNLEAYYYAP